MSSIHGNCCFKLNYFLCGTKEISPSKRKISSRDKSILSKAIVDRRVQSECLQRRNNNLPKVNVHRSSDWSYSTLNNEIITKDVIIHRNHRYQTIGLTLSYQIKSNSKTNIFIEKVDPHSIAHYQGKLERGDQIIKINNQRVKNRDQAIQLIYQNSILILQIIPSNIGSSCTEHDSGVILPSNTDFDISHQNYSNRKRSSSYPSTTNLTDFSFRRCLSLNNLTNEMNNSQSLFDISTDNEKGILKPLPFNYSQYDTDSGCGFNQYQLNSSFSKQNQMLITTDDEKMSDFKQGKYWTKQQRKKQFKKCQQRKKQSKQISSIHSIKEDFYLLNRIFLRENQQELKKKPYLAIKYKQQSNIEEQKLKYFIQKYPLQQRFHSQSTTHLSFNNNFI